MAIKAETMSDKKKLLRQLDVLGVEHLAVNEKEKECAKRKSEIKAFVADHVMQLGEKTEKGHSVLNTENIVFTMQRKTSVVISEGAEDILKKKNLFEQATKRVIDPAMLQSLYMAGKLDEKDLEKLLTEKETFAFFVAAAKK